MPPILTKCVEIGFVMVSSFHWGVSTGGGARGMWALMVCMGVGVSTACSTQNLPCGRLCSTSCGTAGGAKKKPALNTGTQRWRRSCDP